ncbi:hypothetical protein [Streptomyces sp. SPB162]|uniref:DUF7144 family membrane protein n=1 Tax=Streptomyces sp. SPB162 TaxID=2940560 RepID=UPI00240543D9|nr:hypothetical protein [Streptomyces sp. SPB162]MDF9813930.1 vacuolar-type H+-ATPase subunit I/STV1 [Streptomyces sp. SPB162]
MSQDSPTASTPPSTPRGGWSGDRPPADHPANGLAAGGTVFAGIMLSVSGVLAILQGIVAIAKDDVYLSTPGYAFRFNLTSWGWIHLILGVIAVVVGYGVLKGSAWGRVTGIALAALNIVANFMFMPYQPIWAMTLIAIDVFVIWSLANYRPSDDSGALL